MAIMVNFLWLNVHKAVEFRLYRDSQLLIPMYRSQSWKKGDRDFFGEGGDKGIPDRHEFHKLKNRHGKKRTENTERIYLRISKFRVLGALFPVAVFGAFLANCSIDPFHDLEPEIPESLDGIDINFLIGRMHRFERSERKGIGSSSCQISLGSPIPGFQISDKK
jgi:hypothetical protein